MKRLFGVAEHNVVSLVHDPATGRTHRAPRPLAAGLLLLDDAVAAAWPAAPVDLLPTDRPVHLCWSPLVRCNLTCPHCLDDKTVAETPPSERQRIAGVLADARLAAVDISGGEPLLLPDLPDLAAALRGTGTAVSCTTNGWHLERRAAELAPVLDAIRVSFDGPDAASHDALRGAGSFDRACRGTAAARAAGIPVQLQVVVTRQTAPRADDFVALADHLGAGGTNFQQYLPIGVDADGTAATALDPEMISDPDARRRLADAVRRAGPTTWLRTREYADGFAVVRADGRVWRNHLGALAIAAGRALTAPADLTGPTSGGTR